jgi:hypothetical protein
MLEIILISMVIPLGAFAAVVALERRNGENSEDEGYTGPTPAPSQMRLIREQRQFGGPVHSYPAAIAHTFPLTFSYGDPSISENVRNSRRRSAPYSGNRLTTGH